MKNYIKTQLHTLGAWIMSWLQPLLHNALIVVFPLAVITLTWAFSIHLLANYMYNNMTAPFLR